MKPDCHICGLCVNFFPANGVLLLGLKLDEKFFLRNGVGAVQVRLEILLGESFADEGYFDRVLLIDGSLHWLD